MSFFLNEVDGLEGNVAGLITTRPSTLTLTTFDSSKIKLLEEFDFQAVQ